MVVQGHIAQQGLLHVLTAVESVGLQNIRYAAVEPLHHAVGSRCSGLGQPVLYAQLLAQLVKLMVASGFALSAGKQAVRELFAVAGQQLGDSDRAGLVQCLQKSLGTGPCLVGLELHEHSTRGPVDCHEQVAPLALVLHLRQLLHVHVHKAWLVALERLEGLLWRCRFQDIEVANPVAAQAPVQTRVRDRRTQKFARAGE